MYNQRILYVGTSKFPQNTPDHTAGSFDDTVGNTFS